MGLKAGKSQTGDEFCLGNAFERSRRFARRTTNAGCFARSPALVFVDSQQLPAAGQTLPPNLFLHAGQKGGQSADRATERDNTLNNASSHSSQESPYRFTRHAHNPGGLYMWGDEAFKRPARRTHQTDFSSLLGYFTSLGAIDGEGTHSDPGVWPPSLISTSSFPQRRPGKRPDMTACIFAMSKATTGRQAGRLNVLAQRPESQPFCGGTPP